MSVQEKQSYLRQQIIESGHNGEAFVVFMQQKLGEKWNDLQIWDKSKLVQIVEQFKKNNATPVQQFPQISEQFDEVTKQDIIQVHKAEKRILYDRYNLYDDPSEKFVKCNTFTVFNDPKSTVIVDSAQLKSSGGFLSFFGQVTEYEFTLKVPEKKWIVVRKNSDFVWLRDYLTKMLPYCCIPAYKNYKKVTGSNYEKEKRMKMVQLFVEGLIAIPDILHSNVFTRFFSEKEQGSFQNFKKGADSNKLLKVISNLALDSQRTKLRLSNGINIYVQQVQKMLNKQSALYKTINKIVSNIATDFNRCSKSVKTLAQLMASMYQSYKDFNNHVPEGRLTAPLELYLETNKKLMQWGKYIEDCAQIANSHLRCMFKFCKHQQLSVVEMLRRRGQAEEEYLKFRSRFELKRQKIFQTTKQLTKWQIPKDLLDRARSEKLLIFQDKNLAFKYICSNDRTRMQNLRDWFAFLNERTFTQVNAQLNQACSRQHRFLIEFSDRTLQCLKNQELVVRELKSIR